MRQGAASRQDILDLRIGNLRLLVGIGGAVVAWLAFGPGWYSSWWILIPVLAFVVLLVYHDKVRMALNQARRAVAYYDGGLMRLDHRWAGHGTFGERFLDKSHLYADDLDLFGKGSLFELLCVARTRAGEEKLASWLLQPAAPPEIRDRQAAVDELRGKIDLREDLAALGGDVMAGVHPDELSRWGSAQPVLDCRGIRLAATLLAAAAVTALVLWFVWDVSRDLFLLLALAEAIFFFRLRKRIRRVVEGVEQPGQDLRLLSLVLARLEREPLMSPRMVELRAWLVTQGLPASRQIARLDRLLGLLDARRNMLFAPIAALLLWEIQFACAIEAWRKESGPAITRWLSAVGEMEALCSLAGYAYEHPGDPFPEIECGDANFEGTDLGHPLLSETACVRNDVRLSRNLRLLVVSGSNMSGKSTLLRTVGTNAVLALAGAPVRARRLKLSTLAIGASIQRRDSLQAGTSRFYAEIVRLRQIVDVTAGRLPLLFLLDELLHGTNSHDRRIGAEALAKDLVRRGAIGLLTTHDLALAHIVDILEPVAANVHFEDFIHDGHLSFDYRLRPGVVLKSNALELMRSVGLQI
jgi:hypothetical protein